MKRTLKILAPLLLAVALGTGDAAAWEAATTHAGLAEQAALSSELHKRLTEQFGQSQGLYSLLTVPPEDAPALFAIAKRLNPTHGYVPDSSGRTTALAWLALGAVVADVPAEHASNHFYDPLTGEGLTSSTKVGLARRAELAALRTGKGPSLAPGGMSAVEWWRSPKNPLGYAGFADQFRRAVSAETPGERSRHLAGSLLSAGAMLHVLHDLGTPSRVRDDISAHQETIGSSGSDIGSRFERIAALAFGRLGIPTPVEGPKLRSLADHFTNEAGTGLADVVSNGYFSRGTLPRSFQVTRNTGSSAFRTILDQHLRRPTPAGATNTTSTRFDLVAARNPEGATWRNEAGTCLAEYRIHNAKIHWSIPDACALDQLEELLPRVAGYGVSFLEQLFPKGLSLTKENKTLSVAVDTGHFSAGTLTVYSEGPDGRREAYFSAQLDGTTAQTVIPSPPPTAVRLTALFDGKDKAGTALLATTSTAWPL